MRITENYHIKQQYTLKSPTTVPGLCAPLRGDIFFGLKLRGEIPRQRFVRMNSERMCRGLRPKIGGRRLLRGSFGSKGTQP